MTWGRIARIAPSGSATCRRVKAPRFAAAGSPANLVFELIEAAHNGSMAVIPTAASEPRRSSSAAIRYCRAALASSHGGRPVIADSD
jgi:hypothetical protein